MKALIFSAILFFSVFTSAVAQDANSQATVATASPSTSYKIEEGTVLKVKSLAALSSKTAKEGDVIEFAVYEDYEVKGKVLIKEGAIVHAFIEDAEHAKGVGKEGSLKIQFNYTKAVDGTKVPLRSTKGTIEGENKGTGAVALAVVVSPLFLLKKGKEAKVAEGKIMEAYVGRDVEVAIN